MKPFIFLGMAGVGKTSIAKSVSHQLSLKFVDTDLLIIADFKQELNSLIQSVGPDKFIDIESEYVLKNLQKETVLAPGGSFIYAKKAIQKIKNDVTFIYLFDEPDNILNRIPNIHTRGILGLENKSFYELYLERHRLFSDIAHFQFNINHLGFLETTNQIKTLINSMI